VREFNNQILNNERPAERAGYAEWIALGAIAAGSVAAIVGMANCSRSSAMRSISSEDAIDPQTVTAPHGDKLMGAVI
jgi:hypothetical protein